MLSKKVIKDIQSLGHKKFRDETRMFIAEGPKIVNEFLHLVPHQIDCIYATDHWVAPNAPVKVERISDQELERISQLKTPHQVLAVVRQFEKKLPQQNDFVVYLDTIQDPGNLGTIIRIADWFGVKFIGCTEGTADVYNPKVVQSTMGSLARVHVFYDENAAWLKQQSSRIYAAALDGQPLQQVEKTSAGVLVIGNESKGIREDFLDLATEKITIPRKGEAESLNAAVATGIILSQLLI